MRKKDRKKTILQRVSSGERVSVLELSRELGVSAVSIRSDLSELEQQGMLLRTHGGAVSNAVGSGEPLKEMTADKQAAAAAAAELVSDNAWIFLGSGSTCFALCRALSSRRVNAVTNSLEIAAELSASSQANVLMTGGNVFAAEYPFLYGDILLRTLDSIAPDTAFVGVSGIDINFGFSLSNSVECSIFAKLRSISRRLIVVSDASKFGRTSFMNVGTLDQADIIITAGTVPDEYYDYCREKNIQLIVAQTEK